MKKSDIRKVYEKRTKKLRKNVR